MQLYPPRTCADLKHRPGWVGMSAAADPTVNMFIRRRLRTVMAIG
jgi:hypothetical protein